MITPTRIAVAASLCGGMKISGDGVALSDPKPRAISPRRDLAPPSPGDRICSNFTYAGWQGTMRLYFGEGAEEHREIVEHAVYLWIKAELGFNP